LLALKLSLLLSTLGALGQGTFMNLNFEGAITPLVPDANGYVPITTALPGWTGYVGGSQVSEVLYDDRNIDAAGISLYDTAGSLQPLQGNYSAFLQGSSVFAGQQSAAIAQVGQIPSAAESIQFLFSTSFLPFIPQVTFGGQTIPVVQLSSNATYVTLGGNISAFAGQTGELRFTALPQSGIGLLDNIQFSDVPTPEPGIFGLSVLGGLLAGWRVCRQQK
jgi:hypothetical protein